jgi:hypothetical protein
MVYTAEITTTNLYWGIQGLSPDEPDLPAGGSNPYAGGTGFLLGTPGGPSTYPIDRGDFRFQVTPVPNLPASGW